ncbi:unnamed protein product [Brugia timori]|uniref:Ovule protein n=1 Tax=Brugia timori TaxID=42155 RepID=A0A0R3QW16_9BILA|nr:unnamed protein product [Brugia timori]
MSVSRKTCVARRDLASFIYKKFFVYAWYKSNLNGKKSFRRTLTYHWQLYQCEHTNNFIAETSPTFLNWPFLMLRSCCSISKRSKREEQYHIRNSDCGKYSWYSVLLLITSALFDHY